MTISSATVLPMTLVFLCAAAFGSKNDAQASSLIEQARHLSDRGQFDDAAIATVTQWKFSPATCGGQPMDSEIAVRVAFNRP